jgi:glycerol-3-phosphate acyltransferase PlsX
VRIAIDAMGGDNAPKAPVLGALQFAQEFAGRHKLFLVGQQQRIRPFLRDVRGRYSTRGVEIIHCDDSIRMDESPAKALREKPDASIPVALRMQREGQVEAFVSAGNTGALMAASLFTLGRLPGVLRPVIGSFLPGDHGIVLLLDVGANTDCKAQHLLQFAIMGRLYLQHLYGIKQAKVALLSIGEEAAKGNELTKAAYPLFQKHVANFIGNVEGRDILRNKADVVVCDGFTGNVLLKFAESSFGVFTRGLKRQLGSNLFSNLGAMLVKPAFRQLKLSYDYKETGGVPLLGVDGISIISHGSSSPRAIKNAIRVAVSMRERDINSLIRAKLVDDMSNEGVA